MNFLLGKGCFCCNANHMMTFSGSLFNTLSFFSFDRYFPFGVDGMLAGSATVFFAYIGFDSVASTAEEVYMDFSSWNLHFSDNWQCCDQRGFVLTAIFYYPNRWRIPSEICHWVLVLHCRYPAYYICWSLLSLLVWCPIIQWILTPPSPLHLLAMGWNGQRKQINYLFFLMVTLFFLGIGTETPPS